MVLAVFLLLGAALSERDAVRVAEGIVRDSQTLGIPYAHPASDRKVFSMSAIVFRARVAVQARFEEALEQLRDAAYAAECEAGRNFGIVSSVSTVDFPANERGVIEEDLK